MKTNHSLPAIGASSLFQTNVPERIIQKTTGHKSIEALHTYERVSDDQYRAISNVLMTNSLYTSPAETTAKKEKKVAVHYVAVHSQRDSGNCLSRVLGDMTNCSIGNITVNVNPVFCLKKSEKEIKEEFDAITKDMPF